MQKPTNPLRGVTPDCNRKAEMHNPKGSVQNVNGSNADFQPNRNSGARSGLTASPLAKPLGKKK